MNLLRLRLPILPTLMFLSWLLPLHGESLWVENYSFHRFPEIEFTAVPLDRSTWRALKEKRIQVRLDGKAALLLSVDRTQTPLHLHLVLDHSDPSLEGGADLIKLWQSLLSALPSGSKVTTQLLTDRCETLLPASLEPEAVLDAIRSRPHRGPHANLRKGLEETAEVLEATPGDRNVVILFAATSDPVLNSSEVLRQEILTRYRDLQIPVLALSLGSQGDRSLLRSLAQESGGKSLHSWSLGNLRSGLGRLTVGLRLAHQVRVESPFARRDGSQRTLAIRRFGQDEVLTRTEIRFPGTPLALPPPPDPPPPAPTASGPQGPVPASGPGISPTRTEPPPRLELPVWRKQGQSPDEVNLAALASSHILVLRGHAHAGLVPALLGLRKAYDNRDSELTLRLYRHAMISLSFLGNTYGKTVRALEEMISEHAATPGSRSAFVSDLETQLEDLKVYWKNFKQTLKQWEERLPEGSP